MAPGWALAHSPIPGIATFYSGALHPFVVPAQWMALVALGMLCGQRGIAKLGAAAVAPFIALGIGLGFSAAMGSPDTDLVLLGGCLLMALLVALARPLPTGLIASLGVVTGLLVGAGSNPDGLAGGARWGSLAGTWMGATLCVLWFAAMAEAATRPWLKVAVRVVASWLAASALLVLALTWVGPARGNKLGVPAAAAVQTPAATS
jgi:hydrogenase/urease accessory protein HupE